MNFEFRGEDPGYEAAMREEIGHGKLSSNTKPNTKCASKVSMGEADSGQQLKGQWYRKDKEEPCSQLANRQKGKKVHFMRLYLALFFWAFLPSKVNP